MDQLVVWVCVCFELIDRFITDFLFARLQISLIYMDDKFNIYQKNLPNMVVKSCDCA